MTKYVPPLFTYDFSVFIFSPASAIFYKTFTSALKLYVMHPFCYKYVLYVRTFCIKTFEGIGYFLLKFI